MAEGGLTVIDGSQLRVTDLRHPIPDGAVTGAELIALAELEVADRLFGLSLPESLTSAALRRLDGGASVDFDSLEFADSESAKKKVLEYLIALADELKDDPLVISVLDGSALRLYLENEDDFVMMAENLFTELDIDDNGKLSKNEMMNAFEHMGVEMGVPPFPESGNLVNRILMEHGPVEGQQIGQIEFVELLRPILYDLADALAENHVAVVQNIKVINGSKLKQILGDDKCFSDAIGGLFEEWVAIETGDRNKWKLWSFLEAKGLVLGLPRSESNEAVALLYDEVFSSVDEGIIGADLSKDAFLEAVKDILAKFAERLEANPVFTDIVS